MSCASPLPAPVVVSICGTCPTCCSVTASKRTAEKIAITMPWNHRLPADGSVWRIKRAVHTVKTSTGASLAAPQYDSTATYTTGASVSYGGSLYTAAQNVPINKPPMTASGVDDTYWTAGDDNPHLYVTLDGDGAHEQWVKKDYVSSNALVAGGENDTDYRVEIKATFRDECEGREIELWDCVLVKVLNCE